MRYYFIPKLSDTKLYNDILETLLSYKNQKLTRENAVNLTNDENELFQFIKKQNENLSFDLFFYKKEKAALRILTVIEDVIPSRIRKLLDVKNELDKIFFFKEFYLTT